MVLSIIKPLPDPYITQLSGHLKDLLKTGLFLNIPEYLKKDIKRILRKI